MKIPETNELKEIAFVAASETFEGVGFVELAPDSAPTTGLPKSEDLVWGSVELLDPLKGSCAVICKTSFMEELLESVYASNPSSRSETAISDTIGEVANTVAGKLVSQLVSAEETFLLGLPKTGSGWPNTQDDQVYAYVTSSGEQIWMALKCSRRYSI